MRVDIQTLFACFFEKSRPSLGELHAGHGMFSDPFEPDGVAGQSPDAGYVMSQNVAEFIWQRLCQWGLSQVYVYPGNGVAGITAGERVA
jgi:hypothetical protein